MTRVPRSRQRRSTVFSSTELPAKVPGSRKARREAAFKGLGTSGNGQVDLTEFMADKTGEQLDKAEGVFKKTDTDSSGGFSLEEFKRYVPEPAGKGGP